MGHLNWIIFVQNVPKKPKFPPDKKKIIMDQLCTVDFTKKFYFNFGEKIRLRKTEYY